MSHLNAGSLMNAELVSRRWYSTASSVHVWRHMFQAEFESQLQSFPSNAHSLQVGGFGFGKRRPDQEWKRMWKTRKALQERWRNGHAAAIYLEGHKDSVYCVQFDEYGNLASSIQGRGLTLEGTKFSPGLAIGRSESGTLTRTNALKFLGFPSKVGMLRLKSL